MANENQFLKRICRINGVAGCLLIRRDGVLLGHAIDAPDDYSELLQVGGTLGSELMKNSGFSYFRHLSFSRENQRNFHVFPIDKFLLGIEQRAECEVADMFEAVYLLINRVLVKNSALKQERS
jgi:hypothetical protein